MKRLLSSLLLFSALGRGDFNARQWRSRAPLQVTPGNAISEFIVNAEVFRQSTAELNDLRIIRNNPLDNSRDNSSEVPYVIQLLAGAVRQNEHAVLIRNKSWTPGKGVQAVLDLQDQAEHNRLRIVTAQHNFKQAILVETSDDAKHWATALADGVIFDISRPEAQVSDLTVTYPTSTRRYVRITIPGWTDPAFLESAWLAEYKERDATRDIIAHLQPAVTQHKTEQTTDLVFDLEFSGQPCDRLVLQTAPGFFSRSVEVSTGNELNVMIPRAGSVISRTSESEHLTVQWGETWDRYIKLTVFNADSAPVEFESATASEIRRVVRFPSNAAGSYWLYLGDPNAHAPSYDFARVEQPNLPAVIAKVGIAEANPAFREPLPPYSERKPWVLNVILGLAVAVMAFITYRFARKATSSKA